MNYASRSFACSLHELLVLLLILMLLLLTVMMMMMMMMMMITLMAVIMYSSGITRVATLEGATTQSFALH